MKKLIHTYTVYYICLGYTDNFDHFEYQQGIRNSFSNENTLWKEIFNSKEPHTMLFPSPLDDLTEFKRLLVLRCIRPDKIISSVQNFVKCKLFY